MERRTHKIWRLLATVSAFVGSGIVATAFADETDVPMGYHSIGIDTYADNTQVIDGECYALVWMREGFDFVGFRADGSLIDAENNDIVHIRALAKDGKCPPVNFVVSERYRAKHPGGSYRVVVLDTRATGSALAGLDAGGRLTRVNGWGLAKVQREDTAVLARALGAACPPQTGSRITTAAKIPEDCRRPRITAFSRGADGSFQLEFTGSERYLTYRVAEGGTIGSVGEAKGENLAEGTGDDEKPVKIAVPESVRTPERAFYRVEAKTDWAGIRDEGSGVK